MFEYVIAEAEFLEEWLIQNLACSRRREHVNRAGVLRRLTRIADVVITHKQVRCARAKSGTADQPDPALRIVEVNVVVDPSIRRVGDDSVAAALMRQIVANNI